MNVILTIVVIGAAASWLLMVHRRLASLKQQVMLAWNKLEADQSNEAIRNVYNRHVRSYNDALNSFPAYLIAPAAGFKPARPY